MQQSGYRTINEEQNKKKRRILLFVIAALIVLGAIGYAIYASQPQKKEAGKANTDKAHQSAWVEYTNSELGVTFSYPEVWGEPKVTDVRGASGKEKQITFAGDPRILIELDTPDFAHQEISGGYRYLGPGFTNYTAAISQVNGNNQRRLANEEGFSTTILAQTADYFIYADVDCVDVGHFIVGMYPFENSRFAGLGVGYFENLPAGDGCPPEGYGLSEIIDVRVQDQIAGLLKSVETL